MAITERYATLSGAGSHDGTSEANAWSYTEAIANRSSGQRVWFKNAGAATSWTPSADSVAGSATAVSMLCGYGATPGDGELCSLDLGSSSWAFSGAGTVVYGFELTSSTDATINHTGDSGSIINCRVESTATSGNARAINGDDVNVVNCVVKSLGSSSGVGALYARGGRVLYNKVITNTTGIYLSTTSRNGEAIGNAVVGVNATGDGILVEAGGMTRYVNDNSIVDFDGAGIYWTNLPTIGASYQPVSCCRNVIWSCGDGIANAGAGTTDLMALVMGNAIGNITSNRYEFGDLVILDDIILTEDPFADAASYDLRLNDAAGGGRRVKFRGVMAPVA